MRVSPTTVAKILREERGPRPARVLTPHERRTRFLRCDVMWSSDFLDLGRRGKLIATLDEKSLFKPGWDLAPGETAGAAVSHARSILERMGRKPLVWKFDHGSAFMSQAFQDFLKGEGIVPYPTQRRAPWTNGRCERENREIRNWLIGAESLEDGDFERRLDEGLMMLNFIKPRAVLGYRRSAEVYFHDAGVLDLDRDGFIGDLEEEKALVARGERAHRQGVKNLLRELGLYAEIRPARDA